MSNQKVTFAEVQRNVSDIANRTNYDKNIIFELLAAYGRSASSITKLRNGNNNLAEDKDSDVLQRGVVYFKYISDSRLLSAIDNLDQDPLVARYNPRYLITTDYLNIAAKDTKKGTTLDIKLADIDRHVDFFYGWTGDEVTDEKTEAVADRRAADKMKELYYEIERVNKEKLALTDNNFHQDLNVFFSRLLFCFFAEDTHVFSKEDSSIFVNTIKDFTQTDGSDLDQFLGTLFNSLDSEDKSKFTSPFSKFPYVNGTLFDTNRNISIPKFSPQARKLILDCGALNWSHINPDIFGSMFQSIVSEPVRSAHGMHYTSVPNIMRTIEPLFLDELRDELDKHYDNPAKLVKLLDRIAGMKIFDPACGSGNFLIIAYKELRKIEHAILERLLENKLQTKVTSRIDLDNFYGIEIDGFACEVAVLSLYLAKHQMNVEFEKQFGKEIKLIPLKDKANIVQGNAAEIDWQEICPNTPNKRKDVQQRQEQLIENEYKQDELIDSTDNEEQQWGEIYLIGNPPYLGSSLQDSNQKKDMENVFKNFKNYKRLDYISIWFKKGSDYIKGSKAQLAFVSTNSICQGEQVSLIWPYIFANETEIGFAHTSFKWTNEARGVAGVTCIVVNLRKIQRAKKYIYSNRVQKEVRTINAYLSDGSDVIVTKRSTPISELPNMSYGCKPVDGGHLIFDDETRMHAIKKDHRVSKYIKKFTSGQDFLKGVNRWCLWISDDELTDAITIEFIKERVEKVRKFREKSRDKAAREMAKTPHQFREFVMPPENSIIIPSTSSQRRNYVPCGYIDKETVVNNASFVIFGAPLEVFALISSRMHMSWMRAVAGRLKTDYRYSSVIVYNNFPVPEIDEDSKREISFKARNVLFARENHTEKTLSEMYDPDIMPEDLRQAHLDLDLAVDKLYRLKPYKSDEERLSDLFQLYENVIQPEKELKK